MVQLIKMLIVCSNDNYLCNDYKWFEGIYNNNVLFINVCDPIFVILDFRMSDFSWNMVSSC